MSKNNLPSEISVFPLSNAVFFPRTVLPLNIFEEKYIQLVNDSMRGERMFGMVQPKTRNNKSSEVYQIGCLGKIISFNETIDKRFVITLSGLIRFKIKKEVNKNKLYRSFNVDYSEFLNDLNFEEKKLSNFNKSALLNKIKNFLNKINYPIDYKELAELNLDQLVSSVSMISPFSVEEKQKLVEAIDIEDKVKLLNEIINFNMFEQEENKTIQ
tara:strand:- start:113 stop:751 length:639 start_codon:yes stop_codon:yes gene_type:complete